MTARGYTNLRLNSEHVAEFSYRPGKCRRDYRMIVLRKDITKAKGEQALFDEIRYFFYITTRTDLTAAQVVACANERCNDENNIEQLKKVSTPSASRFTTWSATGPTWSSRHWPGTSNPGSP
ncbi:hypothetical protein [Saccharopolyspora sp. ASAGF58]|uniref:hypothetical protein n=1 Tax=Saccharopolyspora sp. ASAGF58 TaxID=2719023 RepID=UPI00143FC5D0|nr:hypothetical protein [Saccharopolyspora sp. ASAGF58]QIZ35147.1 hypothetical protein FDZ84_10990 [Saccharopolyspora sp. ASAGF58]